MILKIKSHTKSQRNNTYYICFAQKYNIKIINDISLYCRTHSANTVNDDTKVYRYQIVFAKKWIRCCQTKKVRNVLMQRIRKYSMLLTKDNLKRLRLLNALQYFLAFLLSHRQDV